MRCADCGAWNAAGAEWCTQCYRRFQPDEPPAEATAAGTGGDEGAAGEPPPPATASVAQALSPASPAEPDPLERDVRERDGTVEWRCATCEGWAPLEDEQCPACGTRRSGFGTATEVQAVRPRGPILALSCVLPGLGHLVAGRVGSGVARLGLTLLWLVGGIALLVGGPGGTGSLPGIVLLVGVVILWAATAVDALNLQAGRSQELLGGRALLWLVVGVTGGLILALLAVTAVGFRDLPDEVVPPAG